MGMEIKVLKFLIQVFSQWLLWAGIIAAFLLQVAALTSLALTELLTSKIFIKILSRYIAIYSDISYIRES